MSGIDVHHYHHLADVPGSVLATLGEIRAAVQRIEEAQAMAASALARLEEEVAQTREAQESAETLIRGLAEQIRQNAGDPAALNRLADELDATTNKLAAAVTENTPQSG